MKRKQEVEKEETIKCNYLESTTWILPDGTWESPDKVLWLPDNFFRVLLIFLNNIYSPEYN